MDHRKKSGEKMWNGNGSTFTSFSTTSITTSSGTSSFHNHQETYREGSSSSSRHTGSQEVPSPPSSFILQRVERLYGPGALAQGFFSRRSLSAASTPPSSKKEEPKEVDKDEGKDSALPVLKLLRPEFRAQLTVARRKSNSPVCSPNRPQDSIDGAVERVMVINVAGHSDDETRDSYKLEERETAKSVEKDGHFYLKLVLEETDRLQRLAAGLEEEVSTVPEHMEGRLRAAAGKARLLASQKLAQFKGLCKKNIVQDPSEDFPTTCEDLAGFWDMVSIQVLSVHEEFTKLDALRKAGWPEQEVAEEGGKKEVVSNGRRKSAPSQSKADPAKASANKARDEARKKMIAERRKAMRKSANTNEDIVLV